jgi:hypothetical protein
LFGSYRAGGNPGGASVSSDRRSLRLSESAASEVQNAVKRADRLTPRPRDTESRLRRSPCARHVRPARSRRGWCLRCLQWVCRWSHRPSPRRRVRERGLPVRRSRGWPMRIGCRGVAHATTAGAAPAFSGRPRALLGLLCGSACSLRGLAAPELSVRLGRNARDVDLGCVKRTGSVRFTRSTS